MSLRTAFITSVLAAADLATGHSIITNAIGNAGGRGMGLGCDNTVPRNGVTLTPFQQDTTIFKGAGSKTVGRTLRRGENRIHEGTFAIMAETGDRLPQITPGGQLAMKLHQVNEDGGGPYTCTINSDGMASSWVKIQVTRNVPGSRGINNEGIKTAHDLVVAINATQQCTGTVAGQKDVCFVRCQNPAPNGPFGGVVPVQIVNKVAPESTSSEAIAPASTQSAAPSDGVTTAPPSSSAASSSTTSSSTQAVPSSSSDTSSSTSSTLPLSKTFSSTQDVSASSSTASSSIYVVSSSSFTNSLPATSSSTPSAAPSFTSSSTRSASVLLETSSSTQSTSPSAYQTTNIPSNESTASRSLQITSSSQRTTVPFGNKTTTALSSTRTGISSSIPIDAFSTTISPTPSGASNENTAGVKATLTSDKFEALGSISSTASGTSTSGEPIPETDRDVNIQGKDVEIEVRVDIKVEILFLGGSASAYFPNLCQTCGDYRVVFGNPGLTSYHAEPCSRQERNTVVVNDGTSYQYLKCDGGECNKKIVGDNGESKVTQCSGKECERNLACRDGAQCKFEKCDGTCFEFRIYTDTKYEIPTRPQLPPAPIEVSGDSPAGGPVLDSNNASADSMDVQTPGGGPSAGQSSPRISSPSNSSPGGSSPGGSSPGNSAGDFSAGSPSTVVSGSGAGSDAKGSAGGVAAPDVSSEKSGEVSVTIGTTFKNVTVLRPAPSGPIKPANSTSLTDAASGLRQKVAQLSQENSSVAATVSSSSINNVILLHVLAAAGLVFLV